MDTWNISQHIRILEELLLHQDFSSNREKLDSLLSDKFYEIDPKGRRQSRESVIRWLLTKDPSSRWELIGCETRELGPDVVQATYQAKKIAPEGSTSNGAFHHSLWEKTPDGHDWCLIFHQSTRIE